MTEMPMRSRLSWLVGLMTALALGFGLARVLPPTDDHSAGSYTAFDATIESVEGDGLRACLVALDPGLLERFGGPVCARVFAAHGVEVAASQRVRVEWFTEVTSPDEESVDAMLLSPARS